MQRDYYTEDLADSKEDAVADFHRVRRFLELEEELYLRGDLA